MPPWREHASCLPVFAVEYAWASGEAVVVHFLLSIGFSSSTASLVALVDPVLSVCTRSCVSPFAEMTSHSLLSPPLRFTFTAALLLAILRAMERQDFLQSGQAHALDRRPGPVRSHRLRSPRHLSRSRWSPQRRSAQERSRFRSIWSRRLGPRRAAYPGDCTPPRPRSASGR